MAFDISLFSLIHEIAGRWQLLDAAGVFFAEYSQYVLITILLGCLWWPRKGREARRPMIVLSLIAALVARLGLKTAVILAYERARPFVVLPDIHPLIATAVEERFQSFPSGHAIFFFALSTVLFAFNRKLGSWFFTAATLMGIARVFVGVHWPGDILGGAVLGMMTGALLVIAYHAYRKPFDHALTGMFNAPYRSLWHRLFTAGIALKGFNGVWETIAGALVLFGGRMRLGGVWSVLVRRELLEDPRDTFIGWITSLLHAVPDGARVFAATYVLIHGLLNSFLAVQLYRNRLWAYLATVGFTGLFIIYQIHRILLYHSRILIAVTVWDVCFIALTLYEYRTQKRR